MKIALRSKNLSRISELNISSSIFIDMDAKRKEVDKLLSDKRNIERKIEKIQAECKHEHTVIKQVTDGSSFAIRRVCESCGHIVGYPSPEEIFNFLQK